MGRNRFFFIGRYIDVGKVELIQKISDGKPIYKRNNEPYLWENLSKKIVPILDKINCQNKKFKMPEDRQLAIDESLRASFSKRDPLRTYIPSKPKKYGQKECIIYSLYCMSNRGRIIYLLRSKIYNSKYNFACFFQRILRRVSIFYSSSV
mgnify:CR=1 FL=1